MVCKNCNRVYLENKSEKDFKDDDIKKYFCSPRCKEKYSEVVINFSDSKSLNNTTDRIVISLAREVLE